jgi:flagellar basal body-associated protein FliL
MKIPRKFITTCVALSIALVLCGCFLFADEKVAKKPEKAGQKKEELTNQFSRAKSELSNLTQKAQSVLGDCETKTNQSIKFNKDANNTESNTYKTCTYANVLSARVSEAQANVNAANEQLSALSETENQPDQSTQNPPENKSSDFIFWLVISFTGLVTIAGIAVLIYYLVSNAKKKQKHAREQVANSFSQVNKKHTSYDEQFVELKKKIADLGGRVDRHHEYLRSLQRQIKEKGDNAVPLENFAESSAPKDEIQFPAAAEDILNKIRHISQPVTGDTLAGMLVQDANKNNEFLIVKNSSLSDGIFYAFPSIDRISTKTQYLTYYKNYYDCDNPTGGMVWIKTPATVLQVDGGWRLNEKGEMETR